MTKTKVFEGKHKGTIAIWKVDDEGKKISEWPIVSMGKTKLEAIVKHLEDIKEFIKLDD